MKFHFASMQYGPNDSIIWNFALFHIQIVLLHIWRFTVLSGGGLVQLISMLDRDFVSVCHFVDFGQLV